MAAPPMPPALRAQIVDAIARLLLLDLDASAANAEEDGVVTALEAKP